MSKIVTTDYTIDKIAAPNLPLAPREWDQRYQDQFANVLRLYFNRLDDFIARLNAKDSTATLLVPYGAFHQDGATTLTTGITNNSTTPIVVPSTAGFTPSGTILVESELINYTAKTSTSFTGITRGVYGTTNVAHLAGVNITEALGVASPTTAKAVIFTGTDASYGIYLDPAFTSRLICSVAGVYNFTFSVQMLNFTTSEDNVTLWFKKNGTDIPFSAGIAQVNAKHGSSPGAQIITWNLIVDLNVSNYIELYFASDTGNTVCATFPAGVAPVHPVSPSVIMTATFVSALPA